jgi:hypothetical protein
MGIAQNRAKELNRLMSVADGPNKELSGVVVSSQLVYELNNIKDRLAKITDEENDSAKLEAVVKEADIKVAEIENALPEADGNQEVKNVLAKVDEVKVVIAAYYENINKEKIDESKLSDVINSEISTTTPSTTSESNLEIKATTSAPATDIILDDWLKSQKEEVKEEFRVEVK